MKTRLRPYLFPLCALALVVVVTSARAGSASWSGQLNSNWNVFQNWSPQTVPNGPSDIATLGGSNNRTVYLSANTEVNSITFPKPISPFFAVNYGITVSPALTLTLSGAGITNNSEQAQNFVTAVNGSGGQVGKIVFTNSATAGSSTVFTNNSSVVPPEDGGEIAFTTNATAANGSFTNNGGTISTASGASLVFFDSSDAGSATITSNGATVSDAGGGETLFLDTSSADSATLIANGGTNGGAGARIEFGNDSTGGTSRVEIFGNAMVDISSHNAPGVGVGSIQGNGNVFLGANNLAVGSNNVSTSFSGVIEDGGYNSASGGSLAKVGTGTLTLSHANTYTGGTIITKGILAVKNTTSSATGPGAVQVNLGTLRGTGKIDGAVTIGNGSMSGAILLGGNGTTNPGTLTINNTLTFNSLSTYKCGLKRSTSGTGQVTAVAGKVSALGVTIDTNVPFNFVDSGTGTLPMGTVFTIMNNTSASPIAGRFSNLAAGLTFTSNGNSFKVSYTGGTGNDLTLKVVQ